MYTLAEQALEVGRKQTDQRLAFTGLHLGNVALVEGCTTHDLNIEVSLTQHAL